ncbi:hypothetical protein [Kineobactrum salinum]|nr:hypothetical protein [Kineobactrum salinum]
MDNEVQQYNQKTDPARYEIHPGSSQALPFATRTDEQANGCGACC